MNSVITLKSCECTYAHTYTHTRTHTHTHKHTHTHTHTHMYTHSSFRRLVKICLFLVPERKRETCIFSLVFVFFFIFSSNLFSWPTSLAGEVTAWSCTRIFSARELYTRGILCHQMFSVKLVNAFKAVLNHHWANMGTPICLKCKCIKPILKQTFVLLKYTQI
jgi:hypothetical protein